MTQSIRIETGVPLPPLGNASKRYPFAEMEAGNSVVVDPVGVNSFRNYARRHDWVYATRLITPGRFRCWRIK